MAVGSSVDFVGSMKGHLESEVHSVNREIGIGLFIRRCTLRRHFLPRVRYLPRKDVRCAVSRTCGRAWSSGGRLFSECLGHIPTCLPSGHINNAPWTLNAPHMLTPALNAITPSHPKLAPSPSLLLEFKLLNLCYRTHAKCGPELQVFLLAPSCTS